MPLGGEPCAVEDECERRRCYAVLGEAGGGVGVVVLYAHELRVLLECPARRGIVGVQVAGDDLGLEPERSECQVDVVGERAARRRRVEIAQMCGEPGARSSWATQNASP